MPSRTSPMRCLALVALLSLAPACAPKERIQPLFPSAADLQVEPKPQLSADDLTSEAALDQHDIAVESWGERGWRTVARICRWAERNGAKGLACPNGD